MVIARAVTTAPISRLLTSDRPNLLSVVSKAYRKFSKVRWVNQGVVSKVKAVSRKASTTIQ